MLIILALLLLVQDLPAAKGSDYEPKMMRAATEGAVLLYPSDGRPGITALRVAQMPDAAIRSLDGKGFRIISLTAVSVNEAITAKGTVYAYLASENRINESGLGKLNGLIVDGAVSFSALVDALEDSDMDRTIRGSENAPDPKRFRTMRNVYVYSIMTRDSSGRETALQVWVEQLTDITRMH
jgi:hypothetical protein